MSTTATIKSSAKVSFDYTSSESTSETKTVKDSNGKEYEVTHTIETEDGSEITFDNLDLTKLDDPTHMDLTISGDADTGEYSMDMQ